MDSETKARIEALENRVHQLEAETKERLDLYRAIQVGDEDTIRHLYATVQALEQFVSVFLSTK